MLKIRQRRRAVRGRCPLLRSTEQRREKKIRKRIENLFFS